MCYKLIFLKIKAFMCLFGYVLIKNERRFQLDFIPSCQNRHNITHTDSHTSHPPLMERKKIDTCNISYSISINILFRKNDPKDRPLSLKNCRVTLIFYKHITNQHMDVLSRPLCVYFFLQRLYVLNFEQQGFMWSLAMCL